MSVLYFLRRRKDALLSSITELKSTLDELAPGNLVIYKREKAPRWYCSEKGISPVTRKRTYIPRAQHDRAEELAYKRYCEHELEYRKRELESIDQCINSLEILSHESGDPLLCNQPEAARLLHQYFLQHPQTAPSIVKSRQWAEEEYIHSKEHPENLTRKTMQGFMVRSKSEALIANALYLYGIPYRYECLLQLDGFSAFPDFTFYNPVTKKIMLWEHFGSMDIPHYFNNNMSKIQSYAQNGFCPMVNLITTFETSYQTLDNTLVDTLIMHFFIDSMPLLSEIDKEILEHK